MHRKNEHVSLHRRWKFQTLPKCVYLTIVVSGNETTGGFVNHERKDLMKLRLRFFLLRNNLRSGKRLYSSRILFVIQILLQSITSQWIHHRSFANAFLCFTQRLPPHPRCQLPDSFIFQFLFIIAWWIFREFYYFFLLLLLLLTTCESWTVWRGFHVHNTLCFLCWRIFWCK